MPASPSSHPAAATRRLEIAEVAPRRLIGDGEALTVQIGSMKRGKRGVHFAIATERDSEALQVVSACRRSGLGVAVGDDFHHG